MPNPVLIGFSSVAAVGSFALQCAVTGHGATTRTKLPATILDEARNDLNEAIKVLMKAREWLPTESFAYLGSEHNKILGKIKRQQAKIDEASASLYKAIRAYREAKKDAKSVRRDCTKFFEKATEHSNKAFLEAHTPSPRPLNPLTQNEDPIAPSVCEEAEPSENISSPSRSYVSLPESTTSPSDSESDSGPALPESLRNSSPEELPPSPSSGNPFQDPETQSGIELLPIRL